MRCPCEKCLLLPICKNRSTCLGINVIKSIKKCSLLKDFLKAKTKKTDIDFESTLPRQEFRERIAQVNNYLPIGTLKILR